MAHVWTMLFITLLVIAFGIAAWHDYEDEKHRKRRNAAHDKVEHSED